MADRYRISSHVNTRAQYSSAVGLVFLFNLIVGTGALAMPDAFGKAGWLIGTIVICLLAFFSYMTSTFVVETMACINALKHGQRRRRLSDDKAAGMMSTDGQHQNYTTDDSSSMNEMTPLQSRAVIEAEAFEITDTIEMGEMAAKLFNKVGIVCFYICMVLYLYGDLAIYSVAVPQTLRDVVCENITHMSPNHSIYSDTDLCWSSSYLSRADVYSIFVAIFAACLGPFVFFNLQKTKLLQIFAVVLRWLSFILMIVLTVIRLAEGGGKGHPPVVQLGGATNLFGVCVYAFMCHHSLPQMATPMRNKSAIYRLFALDYFFIFLFYILICFTAVFTFADIQDLYTLNFGPEAAAASRNPITRCVVIQYFLALFPVFTLSSSFPIIAITLRNNLKTLFMLCRSVDAPYPCLVDRVVFPLLAITIPIAVAFATTDVQSLVGFTGSYAGAGIQYILPATFVFLARRQVNKLSAGSAVSNPYQSPFRYTFYVFAIFGWSAICIALVTVNHILSAVNAE